MREETLELPCIIPQIHNHPLGGNDVGRDGEAAPAELRHGIFELHGTLLS